MKFTPELKTLPHIPGYAISPEGIVFSLKHNWRGYGIREMKATPNSHGYLRARLTVNGRRKSYLVHRLVADAYLGERPSLLHEIRHLDGSRTNNFYENLAWGTKSENALDRSRHGNHVGRSKLSKVDVVNIRKILERGIKCSEISAVYNVCVRSITNIKKGATWKYVS